MGSRTEAVEEAEGVALAVAGELTCGGRVGTKRTLHVGEEARELAGSGRQGTNRTLQVSQVAREIAGRDKKDTRRSGGERCTGALVTG